MLSNVSQIGASVSRYDFDGDGKIGKEDAKFMLTYIPAKLVSDSRAYGGGLPGRLKSMEDLEDSSTAPEGGSPVRGGLYTESEGKGMSLQDRLVRQETIWRFTKTYFDLAMHEAWADKTGAMHLEGLNEITKNKSSDLYFLLMQLFHAKLPCAPVIL